MTTRRQFLATASLAVSAVALAPLPACSRTPPADGTAAKGAAANAASSAKSAGPGAMQLRAIPSSGETIPVIGAGSSGSHEVAVGTPAYEAVREVARVFFAGGGRVVDTSPNYTNAEEILGTLLAERGHRARCFLATKLAADDREALEAQWAGSLRRLQTDKVELLQVHNLRAWEIALPFARELKEQGLTRYVGLTHYQAGGHAELERLMRAEKPDFIQVNYSVNAPQAAERLLPAAQELGVAVLTNRTFEDGRLFDAVREKELPGWAAELGIGSWSQMFLKFALSHPAVTAVIPATGKPERQADQLLAGQGAMLTAAQQAELRRMLA